MRRIRIHNFFHELYQPGRLHTLAMRRVRRMIDIARNCKAHVVHMLAYVGWVIIGRQLLFFQSLQPVLFPAIYKPVYFLSSESSGFWMTILRCSRLWKMSLYMNDIIAFILRATLPYQSSPYSACCIVILYMSDVLCRNERKHARYTNVNFIITLYHVSCKAHKNTQLRHYFSWKNWNKGIEERMTLGKLFPINKYV